MIELGQFIIKSKKTLKIQKSIIGIGIEYRVGIEFFSVCMQHIIHIIFGGRGPNPAGFYLVDEVRQIICMIVPSVERINTPTCIREL